LLPERPATYRGGYRVLEVDLHAHTRFSDGFLSPFDLVLQARRRGLDALAITEHNILFPAQLGRWFSRLTSGPTILVGEEVTTRRFHVTPARHWKEVQRGRRRRESASFPNP